MSGCNHCANVASKPLFSMKGYDLVECTACGLAYIANQPTAAQLTEIYSASADYHAGLQQPGSKLWQRMDGIAANHIAFLKTVVQSGNLVDVGCSTGQFLAKARDGGFGVAGVEFSAGSASYARSHFGLNVEQGAIHDSALGAESLDVLTMFDVIEHVPDPAADIAAAYRLLKPGGWFVLSTPNIDGLFPRLSYKLAHKLNYWPHPEPPHHLYQFSVRTLSAMLIKAGFAPGPVRHSNIELSYTFGTPSTLARMPKRLAYAMAFAPLVKLGPLIGQGDWFYIATRKPA
jgi:2-polyprenyl-3-methyl-5-hydroxy-6-metoxy-1,4-benzoquinol methylase